MKGEIVDDENKNIRILKSKIMIIKGSNQYFFFLIKNLPKDFKVFKTPI
ncbi:MAG: hypothetical protein XD76_1167 [candidate division TA06 bacterium 32_111]|uniref:Uncharacterized protein n=1 Tax=candidate division TA06 bacterium 34_109 TaxID=1635277 RepID=A0A124G0H8_UNCT6|nr:MAG: hypothetical protein XD76_1167 [candidate division TA06 bacterium 32_111]KUK87502.1 MAG: hypothetical protein XE03_0669 [candidate division TA06 bacterium 34_109]